MSAPFLISSHSFLFPRTHANMKHAHAHFEGVLAFIMFRNLRRDIARYNEEDKEEAVEQTGWKLVHGDVFRPPTQSFW